jgi:hypothetical protein
VGSSPLIKTSFFAIYFWVFSEIFCMWKSISTGGSKATAYAMVPFPLASSAGDAGKRQWKCV